MKRILITFSVLLMLAGSAGAYENLLDIQMGGQAFSGDTIRTQGQVAEFQVWIENKDTLGGMSIGFEIWSPDGATWAWENVGGLGAITGCVKTVLTSRLGDGSVFDMTGFLVTEADIDELGPTDVIMCGGVAMMVGLPIGPLQHMYSYSFAAGGDGGDDNWRGTLCFDSVHVPPSGAFVFVDLNGSASCPVTLWANGGRCWPVAPTPQMCAVFTGGPTSMDVDHCGSESVTLSGFDPEGDDVTFALISQNGGAGTAQVIDNGDGTCDVIYTAAAPDVGATISIDVGINDPWHIMGNCEIWNIDVNVTNNAPTIDCGSIYNPVCFSYTKTKTDIVATDIDACDGLTYLMLSGPGTIDPTSGEFTWNTTIADVGMHVVCVGVTDGIEMAECCFDVEVMTCEQYLIVIEKAHDVLQGHFIDIDICWNRGAEPFAGFDFLIGYDASALAFTEATLSDFFIQCGWEYFTYRYNWNGNCGNACPTGLLRLIGLAETNNGPNHPDWDCLAQYNMGEGCTECGTTIATMTFFVSNDRTFECMYAPIRFYWEDCNDNSMSSGTGDSLYVSDHVYDFEGTEITDPTYGFPTYFGVPDDPCMEGDKVVPIRFIELCNGGVDIVCADSIDARGDINVNGVEYEIADAVMFTNYFINGLISFTFHVESSIAASDVNADGIALSVADLVYLIRVIVGDANPYPKPLPETPVTISAQGGMITYDSPVDMGAALLTFQVNGDIGQPQLGSGAATMDMKFTREGNELRVLVYNIGSEMITAGANTLVTIPGEVELTGAEVATYDGFGVDALVRNLPRNFAVSNYPNPFNPSTTIKLTLPIAAEWLVEIYNISGQLVRDYSGYAEAGEVNVEWNGTDNHGGKVASGIYLYNVKAGQFNAAKKILLMK